MSFEIRTVVALSICRTYLHRNTTINGKGPFTKYEHHNKVKLSGGQENMN